MLLATHLLLSSSLPLSSTTALSSTPCRFLLLSLYSRMMNNNRGIVAWNTPWKRVPLIYERDHARSLDHHRILFVADAICSRAYVAAHRVHARSCVQVNTGRGQIWKLRAITHACCIYLPYYPLFPSPLSRGFPSLPVQICAQHVLYDVLVQRPRPVLSRYLIR